jgi:hypothetical protein
VTGECKLCLRTRLLCDSHIIPEFCYKALYEKNRMIVMRVDGGQTARQKGFWEHLLCAECEQRLNKNYETPFREYWLGRPVIPKSLSAQGLLVRGFDYATFKLFHLSVLWRASVSRLKYFRAVSLGARYEKRIREMLLARNPGTPDHFPIVGVVLVDAEDRWSVRQDLIGMPTSHRFGQSHAYALTYLGCNWIYLVTDHPSGRVKDLVSVAPQLDGTMTLAAKDFRESLSVKIFLRAVQTHKSTKHQSRK